MNLTPLPRAERSISLGLSPAKAKKLDEYKTSMQWEEHEANMFAQEFEYAIEEKNKKNVDNFSKINYFWVFEHSAISGLFVIVLVIKLKFSKNNCFIYCLLTLASKLFFADLTPFKK